MKTLKIISAESFISDEEYAKQNVRNVAHNLYPLLLKTCYLHEKVEIIYGLVENWPLSDFNFGNLLGKTADIPEDISHWTCHRSLSACLNGLKNYVLNCNTTYTKRLKVVDTTALKDVEYQPCKCKQTLGKWARTELLAKLCFDLLVEMQQLNFDPSVFGVEIEVFANLFVTQRNYELVVQALLMKRHCPLKLRCVGFRADSLSLRNLFYILKLSEPTSIHRLEMVHNIRLQLEHLEVLLTNVTFPQLISLTLPAQTFNVNRYTAEDEEVLCSIGEKLSNMTHLTELSLSFSTLTGRVRKLLSPLKTPLKILEVANCSLNYADMAYLANSLHAEHFVLLDLSGHSVTDLFPSTFFKLLTKASRTLKTLVLEECDMGDTHVNMLTVGLTPCRKLQEFKFLGNPMTSRGLKRIFRSFADLPMLKYIEFPVPRDCYPDDVTYPLDDSNLVKFDRQKYQEVKEVLHMILLQAHREDIVAVTPLFGSYDPEIQETGNELGKCLLESFKGTLENFSEALKKLN
ncbi:leucine-rich repeat-containing protein 14B [Bombina bombina]|uniref:leucine-rich repeat-containing protein 14B n=1 Tax=Bombina bombina TaxID=8345 RepID=UPI00235B063E|nr:leucine-rich repeat-containing protein 14B [Bombina bombina]